MTLYDFLTICGTNDYVGIYNMDTPCNKKHKSRKRFEEFPTQQSYFKVDNIPFGRIRNFLDYDITHVNHTEKGYLIRITSKRKQKQFEYWEMAREIAKEIKRNQSRLDKDLVKEGI